jgi:cytochrome c oxidase subunit IV
MEELFRQRITVVWLGLVVATLISWQLGVEDVFDDTVALTLATVAVLGVAFVKIRFVGLDVMEIRHAPRVLRLVFYVWMVAVYLELVVLYLTSLGNRDRAAGFAARSNGRNHREISDGRHTMLR